MKKRLITVITVIAMLTMLLSACGSDSSTTSSEESSTTEESASAEGSEQTDDKINVYFIPKNLGNPYFESMGIGFERGMAEIGAENFNYTFTGPANAEATSQIEYIDAAVQNGAEIIIIEVNSEDALNSTLDEARQAGVTVIIINGDIIGSEEYRDGVIMPVDFGPIGEELIENCGAQIGYEGQFAVLSSTTDAVAQNIWIESMNNALENDPKYANMELLEIVYGDDQPEKSTTETEALIAKHPDMKAIIAPTTVGIRSAAKVVQTMGIADKVMVSGLGMPSEMKEFILDGTVESFQLWDPPAEGYVAAYITYAVARDGWKFVDGATLEAGERGTMTVVDNGQVFTLSEMNIYNMDNIEEYADLF